MVQSPPKRYRSLTACRAAAETAGQVEGAAGSTCPRHRNIVVAVDSSEVRES